MIRFFVVFQLTSDMDPNYKHVHTLKGIAQHTLGPWTQYQPVLCVPRTEAEPCNFDDGQISRLNVRPDVGVCATFAPAERAGRACLSAYVSDRGMHITSGPPRYSRMPALKVSHTEQYAMKRCLRSSKRECPCNNIPQPA